MMMMGFGCWLLAVGLLGASACAGSTVLDRIDCHPERGLGGGDGKVANSAAASAREEECYRRACYWSTTAASQANETTYAGNDARGSCFFPANFNCYTIKRLHDKDQRDVGRLQQSSRSWLLERRADCPASGFRDEAERLKLELNVYGGSLINIKITSDEPDSSWRRPKLPEINLPPVSSSATAASTEDNGSGGDDDDSREELIGSPTGDEFLQLKVSLEADKEGAPLRVTHHKSGKVLFETHLQKLIHSRRFIQFATRIGSPLIYGLGLHMGESLLKNKAKIYTMFNYGHPPQRDGRTSYSSYPFYVNVIPWQIITTPDNNQTTATTTIAKHFATGAFMLNTNAMDVVVHGGGGGGAQDETGGVTWRLVGGSVDLFLFLGEEPHDVIGQYQSLVGRPTLPAAWALGYHQSRLNYDQLLPMKQAWARTRGAGVPVESIWTDLDFLWHSTSYALANPELDDLVQILQQQFGMHHVSLVDPALSLLEDPGNYEALKLAVAMDLLAFNPAANESELSLPAVVSTWSDRSVLLDFTHSEIVNYLVNVLREYKKQLHFDGLWLDMNEPEVFANEKSKCLHDEQLQYWPGGRQLNDRTLCMAAEFEAGNHFDVHQVYAFYQSKAHHEALKRLNPDRRPFLISRAQFSGQAKYGGSWLGDLSSQFDHMHWSLLGTIESSWLGQPLVGADICGFFGTASDELCARWFSLGAFYPLARNHNHGLARDQDPGALSEHVQRAARLALMRRYSLLPHLYTLFYQNYLEGEPVVSSPAFAFFKQANGEGGGLEQLADLSKGDTDQLVWGRSLMVAPVLERGRDTRDVHLPRGRWYDVSIGLPGTDLGENLTEYDSLRTNWPTGGKKVAQHESHRGNFMRLYNLRRPIDCLAREGCLLQEQWTPVGAVNVYLRGGTILATLRRIAHTSNVNSIWARASFFLEVALDEQQSALGSLFWDSGESDPRDNKYNQVHLWASSNQLELVMLKDHYKPALDFSGFVVYGAKLNGTNATPATTVYRNVRLVYNYDHGRNILTCEFKSQQETTTDSNTDESLSLKRYENIIIKW